ncbi:hypothetical protein J7K93_04975 [bacterium]|nr:hypothetical protein [bacterium]
MSAEIAIMNRSAVALAADSAVTINRKENVKIYNTVNKLFTLSKYHPVGIMVYGSADLMGVPWESIIKIYRNNLLEKSFSTLEEYAQDFMNYLDKDNKLFPEEIQDNYFKSAILNYFSIIKRDIDKKVKDITDQKGTISTISIENITKDTIREHFMMWEKAERLSHLPKSFPNKIIVKFDKFINESISKVFQKLPVFSKSTEDLKAICGNLFFKDKFPQSLAGIVIAGFGDEETFPALSSFKIEAVINNRLKYKFQKDESFRINFEYRAAVIPFAQRQNVYTFVEGIDPNCKQIIFSYIEELLKNYPSNIIENIMFNSMVEKKTMLDKMNNVSKEIFQDFMDNINKYIKTANINPILNAVEFLPKDELSSMAEALVSLTSFKQKISMDSETVGGPIDVAVISKGDGFVWIKRKHYFKPELNPHYLSKYFYTKAEEIEDETKIKSKK